MQKRTVTLVDHEGNDVGSADILEAHTSPGMLHRAFSVYVLRNIDREILIQRRSAKKMLWAGIWANTACSHPFDGETATQAGERRLREELGFTVPLTPLTTFVYQAEDPKGKGAEYEHVTILRGEGDGVEVVANPDEVMEWRWANVDELRREMEEKPDTFAPWFHKGLALLLKRPTSPAE